MDKIYLNLLPLLKRKKKTTFLAKTTSMWPLILPKDKVVVETISINKVKINDIIAYYNQEIDKIIVHRVVNVQGKNKSIQIRTKPDVSNTLDKTIVTTKNYFGKITSIKRKNKTLQLRKHNFYWLKYNFKIKNYKKMLNKIFNYLFF